ncbi:4-(cytidine 5'-diphospho)-2-C-methyl-D-erythritol kinase [Rhizobium sp. PAMB 3182]
MHAATGEEPLVEHARAKLNLALHVTGQRPDGYHLLESLVVFAEAGDRLTFTASAADSLTLSGPFAASLPPPDENDGNLVTRARDRLRALLADHGTTTKPVAIHLEKNLPVASGIGGGSADAAAAIRGLMRFWSADAVDPARLSQLALSLGADVPMCLSGRPLVARGIGEEIETLRDFPTFHLVLVNPLKEVSTPAIFRRLTEKNNPPLPTLPSAGPADAKAWIDYLAACRNDLQPPAEEVLPEIANVIAMLTEGGALLARMSGSGATCFGLYTDQQAAQQAADALRQARPEWYVEATQTTEDRT